MSKTRRIIITSALLYANGDLHFGHLLETVGTDIWYRFHCLQGHDCLYLCGSDAHGTPIMLTAKSQGISPDELIAQVRQTHQRELKAFQIGIDNFYTTHSDENKSLVAMFYERFKEKNDIEIREIKQAYDEQEGLFLPDRFVKGRCCFCGTCDQYGDNCEACGATYSSAELEDPISVLSGTPPVQKTSMHYFFQLDHYASALKTWVNSGRLQPQVSNKLLEWFKNSLNPWDISRDAPYFGFEIPDAPNKYFYVWLDAPIGYMASLQHFCNTHKEDARGFTFDEVWHPDSAVELYHFIGKDIMYFHGLFWPAILLSAGFRMPTALFAHGFLTVNGQKMSKSRGTFITVKQYLDHLDPTFLRYYFATKLNAHVEDMNFSTSDFMQRVNTDLVGKFINIASRASKLLNRSFDGMLADHLHAPALFDEFLAVGQTVAMQFEQRELSQAMRTIMSLADKVNVYLETHKPWALAKENPQDPLIQSVCSMGIHLFRMLTVFLKPVIPQLAHDIEAFLCEPTPLMWSSIHTPLLGHRIRPYQPLIRRITQEQIDRLMNGCSEADA